VIFDVVEPLAAGKSSETPGMEEAGDAPLDTMFPVLLCSNVNC
jgi:hypothetical protein